MLNGFSLPKVDVFTDAGHPGQLRSIAANGNVNVDAICTAIKAHEKVRDAFFKQIHPMGVSVSKWSYGRLGHQQDQFVGNIAVGTPFIAIQTARRATLS